eukprot:1154981-Pelagomonas_calceolata.AAC.2
MSTQPVVGIGLGAHGGTASCWCLSVRQPVVGIGLGAHSGTASCWRLSVRQPVVGCCLDLAFVRIPVWFPCGRISLHTTGWTLWTSM